MTEIMPVPKKFEFYCLYQQGAFLAPFTPAQARESSADGAARNA